MWSLISITKRRCLRSWIVFFGLLFALTLVQTLTGALAEITLLAWGWLFLATVPAIGVLLVATLADRQSARVIPRFNHRLLVWGTLAYGVLLLLTLLAEGWATHGRLSMAAYRRQSFLWLLPSQGLLLIGYAVSLWSKAPFIAGQHQLGEVAEKEAARWASLEQPLRQEAFDLLGRGKLGEALELTVSRIETSGIGDLNAGILLRSRYQQLRQKQISGLITDEGAEVEQNKLTLSLMELIRRT